MTFLHCWPNLMRGSIVCCNWPISAGRGRLTFWWGFLTAAPLALELELGFVMVRKQGKLPGETVRHVYELEYGTDTVEIQADAIKPGQRVVVLDDLMATGGTMTAAIELIRKVGGTVAGVACIIELEGLGGRDEIDVPFKSLVQFEI